MICRWPTQGTLSSARKYAPQAALPRRNTRFCTARRNGHWCACACRPAAAPIRSAVHMAAIGCLLTGDFLRQRKSGSDPPAGPCMPIRFLLHPLTGQRLPSPFRCPGYGSIAHPSSGTLSMPQRLFARRHSAATGPSTAAAGQTACTEKRQKDPVHESAPNCHHCTGRLPERSNAAHFAHANACHQNIRTEHQADPTGHRLPFDGVQPPLCENTVPIPENAQAELLRCLTSADCRPVRFSRQYRNVTVLLL